MTECSEQGLFLKAREDDRAAFASLQEVLEPAVRGFVRRLVGQSDAEDDIVQETFLALFMNLKRIDPVENLRPFLFRIVRNLCYDELRRKGRFRHTFVSLEVKSDERQSPYLQVQDPRTPPDEAVQTLLLFQEVQQAIEQLPELQRQTMILYAEEDFTYEQIAATMSTSVGTVKSRLHYARQNLLRLMQPAVLEALGVANREKGEK